MAIVLRLLWFVASTNCCRKMLLWLAFSYLPLLFAEIQNHGLRMTTSSYLRNNFPVLSSVKDAQKQRSERLFGTEV